MIFVTVGTQKFQMDRLIKGVDEIARSGIVDEEFFIQSGHSTYTPTHCRHIPFMVKEELDQKVNQCSLLICHAGVGSILMGLKKNIKVIVVPRMEKYGEHVDDHQIEIAESFAKAGYIKMVKDVEELATEISRSNNWVPVRFESNKDRFSQMVLNIVME